MSRRRASVSQAEIARVIRAARAAGAAEVELVIAGVAMTVRLNARPPAGEKALEGEIKL